MNGNGMSVTERSARAQVLVAIAVLLGLFAMHGLSGHGTMQHDSASMGAMAPSLGDHAPTHAPIIAAIAATAATGDTAGPGSQTVATVAGAAFALTGDLGGDTGAGGMAGICLAFLMALMLLVARHPRWSRSPMSITVLVRQRPTIARAARRDRDPPSLILLSIRRC